MRNSKGKTHHMATSAVWASLIVCACLLVGSAPAFAQEITTTDPDATYGKGGTKTTKTDTHPNGDKSVTIEIKDSKGALRERHRTHVLKLTGKLQSETHEFLDCKEHTTSYKDVIYDFLGNEKQFTEEKYDVKDGEQISGFKRTTDENGKKTSQRYNRKTKKYEDVDVAFEAGPTSKEISTPPRDTTTCNACKANQFVGLGQLIREDAKPDRFNTYGFSADFTHLIGSSCRIGVTGDFNADFRTRNGEDLTKTSVLGGLTLIPFKGLDTTTKERARHPWQTSVTFSTHALFGVSHFSSTFGSVSSTDNAFTMKLGGALDVNVNNGFFFRPIQIDYAPTFFGGNTQNNFQFGFGAGFRFGKGKQRSVSEKKETVPTPVTAPTPGISEQKETKDCFATVTLIKVRYDSNLTTPGSESSPIEWEGQVVVGGQQRRIGLYHNLKQQRTVVYPHQFSEEECGGCPGDVNLSFDISMEAKGGSNPFAGDFAVSKEPRKFPCPGTTQLEIPVQFPWGPEKEKRIQLDNLKLAAKPLGMIDPKVVFTFYFKVVTKCRAH